MLTTLSALFLTASMAQNPEPTPGFRLAGYLPDWRVSGYRLSSGRYLTDLLLFSADPGPDGALRLRELENIDWGALKRFKTDSRVRLILCVGGWGRSEHFAAVAQDAAKRRNFVDSALRLSREKRLDGLDLDWEHPKDAAEEEAYGDLMADLAKAFRPEGLLLSVTIAGWQRLPKDSFQHVDWVQLMAYDQPVRHSTFQGMKDDIDKLLALGVPKSKLVVGVPFYGRSLADWNQTMTYAEVLSTHKPGPAVDEVGGFYFNGKDTIVKKTRHAIDQGYGGMMIWEVAQDAPGDASLLKAMYEEMNRKR